MCGYEYEYLIITWVRVRVLVDEYAYNRCVWLFSPLHHRCTIGYQYSGQYSYAYLSACPWVRVQVRVLLLCNLWVRVKYEHQKFSSRVLRVRVPSTSTPALDTVDVCCAIHGYINFDCLRTNFAKVHEIIIKISFRYNSIIHFAIICIIIPKSDHNFHESQQQIAKSWLTWIIIFTSEQQIWFVLCAHKHFMKRAPGLVYG